MDQLVTCNALELDRMDQLVHVLQQACALELDTLDQMVTYYSFLHKSEYGGKRFLLMLEVLVLKMVENGFFRLLKVSVVNACFVYNLLGRMSSITPWLISAANPVFVS